VCWYRHRPASVEASQLVSLLVAHDATLSRGDAVERARLLTRYGFLRQLSGGTNVLIDAGFTELKALSDKSFANAPVMIPSMITIGEEMITVTAVRALQEWSSRCLLKNHMFIISWCHWLGR